MELLLIPLCGFLLTLVLGKGLIPVLQRLKAGQSIKEDGPTWHMAKEGTPTMGGLMFMVSMAIVTLAFSYKDLAMGNLTSLFMILFAMVFGAIGFLDDYAKVKKKENTGLTAGPKFLLQLAAAILFVVLLRNIGVISPNVYIPFLNWEIRLTFVVYMIFASIVIVGAVNAVNITDGVDGLATGVTLPVCLFFAAIAYFSVHQWGQMYSTAVLNFSLALFGSLLGFLVYNFHPAKVFMGDTGSLFLGGAVCAMAFAMDVPVILILVGIIYVCEAASVILQVTYFKITKGKRIFRMAPLHHHFEMGGWSEVKLFVIFTGITALCCVLAYSAVISRYAVLLS